MLASIDRVPIFDAGSSGRFRYVMNLVLCAARVQDWPFASRYVPTSYPPAIAPTIRNGSVPRAIASGSGASGAECDQSSLADEKAHHRAAPLSHRIARGAAQHWVARFECIEYRPYTNWPSDFEFDFTAHPREDAQV